MKFSGKNKAKFNLNYTIIIKKQSNNLTTSLIFLLRKKKSMTPRAKKKFSPTRESLVGLNWRI
jgi:hypothetical protein